jgi:hypothetical protein
MYMQFKSSVVEKYRIVAAPEVWYHGRTVDSDEFDLAHVGKEEAADEQGVGFYFTTNEKDAAGYAHPNGIVLTVELSPRKLVSLTSPAKEAEVDYLINNTSEDFSDWDEDPEAGRQMFKDSVMNESSAKETFESIWYDLYRYEPRAYLENMIKLGYDGHYSPRTYESGIRHIIIYNPKVIKVLKKEPLD